MSLVVLLSASPASAELGAQSQAQSTTVAACPSKATLLYEAMPDETHTPCMAVVIFKPGVAAADQPDVVRGVGAQFRLGVGLINGASVFVPNEAALRGLLNNPSVQDIRPDGRARIMAPPGACTPWPSCKNGGGTDDTPPTVSVTSPADGATVSGTVTVAADATDNNGVNQVEFFVDGSSIGKDTDGSGGWSVPWNSGSVADGSHTVTATATDTAKQTASDSVSVTVNNGGSDVSSQVDPAGYLRIRADLVAQTGFGVGVAIVDTGVDLDHPDLVGNLAAECFDLAYSTCDDDHGHGTHVAGTVAAVDNTQDIIGVAPAATIYAVKVLDSNGGGLHSDVLAGLDWVYNQNGGETPSAPLPIAVVNMSLGDEIACGSGNDPGYDLATTKLADQGVVVVAAAGNDRTREISGMVPAGCPDVLAVASTTAQKGVSGCRFLADIPADVASYFTTDGAGVAISAPGETQEDSTCGTIKPVGILSLRMGGGTTQMSGTSMAAPHVAGVAALMLEADSSLSPADVRANIGRAADRCGEAPIPHPYVSQSDDGVREGILHAPRAVSGTGGC